MRRHHVLTAAAVLLLDSQLSSPVGAADLAPLSGVELRERCLAYADAPQSADSRSCAAYIRGFIEGSMRVVLRTGGVEGKGRESFSERALRTRLGAPIAAGPDYCVHGELSLQEFITQILAYAQSNPPEDETSASTLLYGTLSQFHRCSV